MEYFCQMKRRDYHFLYLEQWNREARAKDILRASFRKRDPNIL